MTKYTPPPHVVQLLSKSGAKLVPVKGWYNRALPSDAAAYDQWKLPTTSWNKDPNATQKAYTRLRSGGWIGLIPATFHNTAVIDLDDGDAGEFSQALDALEVAHIRVKTGGGGAHFYIRVDDSWPSGNWKWSLGGASGDIRYDKGYVIVWSLDALHEVAELEPCADAAGLAALLGHGGIPAPLFEEAAASSEPEPAKRKGGRPRKGYSYPPGDRDDRLWRDLSSAVGKRDENAIAEIRAAWEGAPEQKPDHMQRFGEKLGRLRREQKVADEAAFDAKDEPTLRECLRRLGIAWAYNERTASFEYKTGGNRFDYGVDTEPRIIADIAASFKYNRPQGGRIPLRFTETQYAQYMRALSTYDGKRIDDFRLWLEGLAEWDGTARLWSVLPTLFGAAESELVAWASQYLCLGAIQRTYEPGCKLDEFPVLIGKQGIGKSALLEQLFPDELRNRWHSGTLDMTATPRERIEAIMGSVIVEVAEMAGVGRDLQKQKQWLTQLVDKARLAYQRRTSLLVRRHAFVGTADRRGALPNDPAGNRRFVAIELRHGANVEEYMAANREQLWAEALHLHRQGVRANLPRGLMSARDAANEDFTRSDDDMDEAAVKLDTRQEYAWAAVVEMVGGRLNNRDKGRLRAALEKAGWRRVRTMREGKRVHLWQHEDRLPSLPLQ